MMRSSSRRSDPERIRTAVGAVAPGSRDETPPGPPDDEPTKALFEFLERVLKK